MRLGLGAVGPVAALLTCVPAPPCARHAAVQLNDEYGKFVRHSELSPGCAPLGVLCAGLSDDELETLALAVEGVWTGADGDEAADPRHVPIVVLEEADMRRRLRDVLAELDERDSVLPTRALKIRNPLVVFSGLNSVELSATLRTVSPALRAQRPPDAPSTMFATAVPRSLDKRLDVLCEEIEGDHAAAEANRPKS